jgi:SAM-dependent methyltransferase
MIARELRGMRSVLDVGCGSSSPLAKVKKHFYSVGVDIHRPSIIESRKRKIHDDYKVGNVLAIDKLFKPREFDAVIALDLIEHLPKEKGRELLKKMAKLGKKKIILLTPNGFISQTPYDGNEFQKHVSGWDVDDFQKHGFRVYGMRGLKWLRGEYATIKWKPWFFWSAVSVVSEFFVFFLPRIANQLFVVKDFGSLTSSSS